MYTKGQLCLLKKKNLQYLQLTVQQDGQFSVSFLP